MQGENVRHVFPRVLFRQSIVSGREQAAIEQVGKLEDARIMEVMEDTCVHTGPVVNRHGNTSDKPFACSFYRNLYLRLVSNLAKPLSKTLERGDTLRRRFLAAKGDEHLERGGP